MRTKQVQVLVAVAAASMALFGCSSDGSDGASPTTAAPTEVETAADEGAAAGASDVAACADDEADWDRTVAVYVVAESQISAQSPPELTGGTVRLAIEADTDNTEPVVAVLGRDGEPIREVPAVAPGEVCGVDVELEPGTYEVTSESTGDLAASFEVVAAS